MFVTGLLKCMKFCTLCVPENINQCNIKSFPKLNKTTTVKSLGTTNKYVKIGKSCLDWQKYRQSGLEQDEHTVGRRASKENKCDRLLEADSFRGMFNIKKQITQWNLFNDFDKQMSHYRKDKIWKQWKQSKVHSFVAKN